MSQNNKRRKILSFTAWTRSWYASLRGGGDGIPESSSDITVSYLRSSETLLMTLSSFRWYVNHRMEHHFRLRTEPALPYTRKTVAAWVIWSHGVTWLWRTFPGEGWIGSANLLTTRHSADICRLFAVAACWLPACLPLWIPG